MRLDGLIEQLQDIRTRTPGHVHVLVTANEYQRPLGFNSLTKKALRTGNAHFVGGSPYDRHSWVEVEKGTVFDDQERVVLLG